MLDVCTGLIDTAEHVDDQLILEANLSVLEEVVEVRFEIRKKVLANLILNACWELLEEWELLNDEVVVMDERILDKDLDRVVQSIRNFGLDVTLFESKKPRVKFLHALVDHSLEALLRTQHIRDSASQYREEGQSDELDEHREDVLRIRVAGYIAISYCGDRGQNEVEGIRVN